MAKEKKQKADPGPQHPNKIGIKEGMGYMLGDAGNLFVLTYVSYCLKLFHTDVLHFSGTKSARLFLFTRLWDAINDPLWGMVVSKRKPSKDGKFRPYLKWICVPLGISALLCFVDFTKFTQSQILITVLAYVTYIAFGMLYTGMNIPFGSLASVITDDPEGRTLLSTFRSIGGGIGGAAPLLVAPLVIYVKTVNTAGETVKVASGTRMLLFGVVMAALSIAFYLWCYKATKERVPSEEDPNIDLKKTYLGLLRSRPFVSVALAGILISGQLQFASLNQYLFKNYFENPNLSVIGTMANYAPMVVMILLTPKLVKRFGKKELAGTGSFFAAAAAVAMFFVTPHLDRLGAAPIVFFALLFVIGFGYSFVSITNWAVVADVIDYQEYKTGLRNESAIYAVYTFCRKLGQTLADVGGMVLLEKFAGYDGATMSNLAYIDQPARSGMVNTVSDGILFICTLIPAIVYTLVWALMQFGYPLTKERLEPIYAYMREKRGEAEVLPDPVAEAEKLPADPVAEAEKQPAEFVAETDRQPAESAPEAPVMQADSVFDLDYSKLSGQQIFKLAIMVPPQDVNSEEGKNELKMIKEQVFPTYDGVSNFNAFLMLNDPETLKSCIQSQDPLTLLKLFKALTVDANTYGAENSRPIGYIQQYIIETLQSRS